MRIESKKTKTLNDGDRHYKSRGIKLALYAGTNILQEQIFPSISTLVPGNQIILHTTIKKIETELRKFDYIHKIWIIFASNEKELNELLVFKDLLNGSPLILILADQKREMVTKALKLYPRFLSYQHCDFKDVLLVLKKMIPNHNLKECF